MSGFSPAWLALRESADHRARDQKLLELLGKYFEGRESISVADLGAGTGSNLRATAPHLPFLQQWTLIDHDPALLAAACSAITGWADSSCPTASGIEASKDGRSILVELRCADLAQEPGAWESAAPNLVTAAALFDLVSAPWTERLVEAVTRASAVFYTALTHSGSVVWSPSHPLDTAMTAAFERHFGGDKGFGPAAGSSATAHLVAAFTRAGYRVERRESPWQLGAGDRSLIAEFSQGWADAVSETKQLPSADIEQWLAARKAEATCIVSHEDLLAVPG